MELFEVMQQRHSIRAYTGEVISEEAMEMILRAGLLSPSGRAVRPWELIVVREREMLQHMAKCRIAGAQMLEKADAAIVVIGDETKTDVWIEDCSIVVSNMHLAAESLGIGSCWIQGRLREAKPGLSTEDYLRECLRFPEQYRLEAILSLGVPARHPKPTDIAGLHTEKIHFGTF